MQPHHYLRLWLSHCQGVLQNSKGIDVQAQCDYTEHPLCCWRLHTMHGRQRLSNGEPASVLEHPWAEIDLPHPSIPIDSWIKIILLTDFKVTGNAALSCSVGALRVCAYLGDRARTLLPPIRVAQSMYCRLSRVRKNRPLSKKIPRRPGGRASRGTDDIKSGGPATKALSVQQTAGDMKQCNHVCCIS